MAELIVEEDRRSYKRDIRIAGGPTIPVSSYGFDIRAERIELRWTDTRDPTLVHVCGPRIKKDGTEGQWRSTAFSYNSVPDAHYPAVPEWLLEIIEGAK